MPTLENIDWSLENIGIYLIFINLLTAYLFYYDKKSAKFGSWRTSEKTLLSMAAIGGTPAAYWAINKFRHKSKKSSFKSKLFVVAIAQFFALIYFGFDKIILGN